LSDLSLALTTTTTPEQVLETQMNLALSRCFASS